MTRLSEALLRGVEPHVPPKYMMVNGRDGTMYLRRGDNGAYQSISQEEWDARDKGKQDEKATEQATGAVPDQQAE